ncbi:acetyltransferase [Rhodomicrobium vannielii ATCC 17100]|uniref:Acetyltransferase n=1 Tax=Rhodomicrobium vannielii (strain ATCC 17100 / DSM 162 / LMG 4299 / NCIMB 10020 / ATH 3.1.1) TaxID=648757 RepID=E3I879_RHOVT|nr:acyltransferase [Rhodomicrobium vannielii]ADP69704.1 acetyltransferase [Rhodomicrobium vannielii ATCC 17100]
MTLLGQLQKLRILVYEIVSTNKLSGQGLRIFQPVHALGSGKITIGRNVTIGVFPSPGYFSGACHIEVRSETAEICIGDGTYLNNDFTAIAEAKKIEIGHRCLIGPRVTIFDSDFHVLRVSDRTNATAIVQRSVKIGDDVFIGAGAIVLKGVSIGDGAVIGAGAVVVSDIPPNVIAAGNPATLVRSL